MKLTSFFTIALILVLLSGCSTDGTSGEGHDQTFTENISSKEAKVLIQNTPDLILLDVRTVEEYELGHLENAVLIPLDQLESRLEELDQNAPILIYCRSGNRSATASKILANNGFSKVYNLEGGILSWDGEIVK